MKVLALETATERCSVALWLDGRCFERCEETAREHAKLILPMVEEVLRAASCSLRELTGIAYGCGPGGFTGVRIAVSVAQGLAFGAGRSVVGISTLAAVAQQVARDGDQVLVCMDARMGEVYCGRFELAAGAVQVTAVEAERVLPPSAVELGAATVVAGSGLRAYPHLLPAGVGARAHAEVLPHAREIALLGMVALAAGHGIPPQDAQPVYLRDEVAWRS